MGERTGILWTKSTFNPWMGCTKVSPACDHCYAEKLMGRRLKTVTWGPGEPRKQTIPATWKEPLRWNAKAPTSEFAGIKGFWPVFCASLADVFDNEVDPEWREDLWALIRATPNLTWQLLTKRVGNIEKMLPLDWGNGYANVWLGATIATQDELNRDGLKLLRLPATKRFFSIEPMLSPIDLTRLMLNTQTAFDALRGGLLARSISVHNVPGISWVICGGESGAGARPMHPEWPRMLQAQCAAANVPFFFKQWGAWRPISQGPNDWYSELYVSNVRALRNQVQSALDDAYGRRCTVPNAILHFDGSLHDLAEPMAYAEGTQAMMSFQVGEKAAGNELDNVLWQQFPNVSRPHAELDARLAREVEAISLKLASTVYPIHVDESYR